METIEILEKARELISDESRWTQGCPARNTEGRYTPIGSPDAVCFCSIGAICKVMFIDEMKVTGQKATEILRKALPQGWGGSITAFNDTKKHSAIVQLFDRAIDAARGVAE